MSSLSSQAVLRRLFWKLTFRGRALSRRPGREGQVKPVNVWGIFLLYFVYGLAFAFFGARMPAPLFCATLHGATLFLVVFQLMFAAGNVLFNKDEAEILLHRPVDSRQLLRAKVSVLCAVAALLAGTLNLPGMVLSLRMPDVYWWFPLTHVISLLFVVLFSGAAIVLLYEVCLRWFGRERLESMMTTAQTIFTVVLVGGSQMFRFMLHSNLGAISGRWSLLVLPPAWFASLDAVLGLKGSQSWMLIPAGGGVVLTLALVWLAFHQLAGSYSEGMMLLNESSVAAPVNRSRGKWVRRLVELPPLSWWLRDPVQKNAFLLVGAYLRRDRETKLRLYPASAQVLVMPFVILFAGSGNFFGGADVGFALVYAGWMPLITLDLLQYSDQWRAAEILQVTPLGRWQPFFHGARKAVLVFLTAPVWLLLASAALIARHNGTTALMMLASLVLIPCFSLIPGWMETWLPFSKPFDSRTQSARGCTTLALVTLISGGVGVLGALAYVHGCFGLFLLGEFLLGSSVYLWISYRIQAAGEWEE